MLISKVSCGDLCYEIGKEKVASIELTKHGSDTTTIYKVSDCNGVVIVFAGLLPHHEIEYAVTEIQEAEQLAFFK